MYVALPAKSPAILVTLIHVTIFASQQCLSINGNTDSAGIPVFPVQWKVPLVLNRSTDLERTSLVALIS